MLLNTIFYWVLTMVFLKKKKRFKSLLFFCIHILHLKEILESKLFPYLVVSDIPCPCLFYETLEIIYSYYTLIILYFEKKVPTAMVNTSTLQNVYQQNTQLPLFQISDHKKTTPYGYGNPDPGLGQTKKCSG